MGRGDKKTKKGKIFKGSHGKARPAKARPAKKTEEKKGEQLVAISISYSLRSVTQVNDQMATLRFFMSAGD